MTRRRLLSTASREAFFSIPSDMGSLQQYYPDGRLRLILWCRSAHKFTTFARFLDEKVGRMNIKPKCSRFVRPYREFMHKPCDGAYYPKENRDLQNHIAKEHLLISQVPVIRYSEEPFQAKRNYFPARNATMSALTEGTIIVEAGDASGTLRSA